MKHFYILILSLFIPVSLLAQSPSDALMMNSNQICVLLDYNYSSFENYWEGESKRDNATIATVRRNSFMAMAAVGILDNLNFFIGLPYIKTESEDPNGGRFEGAQGFQDITLAVKYRWLNKTYESGTLTGLATVGFSTPVTNYLPDYMPYSIGMGATEFSYRAILEYRLKSDWYARGAGAFLWRGYAQAEREYYYANGSYYTDIMDVPNALTAELVVGKWFFLMPFR